MKKQKQYLRSTRRIQNERNGRRKDELVNLSSSSPPRLLAEPVSEFKYHDHLPRCFQSHRKLIVLCRHVHPVYQVTCFHSIIIIYYEFVYFIFFISSFFY